MINQEAQAAYFKVNAREFELALCLDEAFDVTYGCSYQGQSFWLCDPKIQAKDRFGFRLEVIAPYTSHSTPDARCLTALDNFLRRPDIINRADRLVAMLAHETDELFLEALELREQDRILVPFPAKSLADKQRNPLFVRSILAERIGRLIFLACHHPSGMIDISMDAKL